MNRRTELSVSKSIIWPAGGAKVGCKKKMASCHYEYETLETGLKVFIGPNVHGRLCLKLSNWSWIHLIQFGLNLSKYCGRAIVQVANCRFIGRRAGVRSHAAHRSNHCQDLLLPTHQNIPISVSVSEWSEAHDVAERESNLEASSRLCAI